MPSVKRIIINIVLVSCFSLIIGVVLAYLVANLCFDYAKKLESLYLWQKAEKRYQLAVRLAPFNARYLSEYGDFLRDKSIYQPDKADWLRNAGRSYMHALKLNPFSADYSLRLGQVRLKLFLLDKGRFKNDLNSALFGLKEAVRNDPNDADMNYAAGYIGISVWNELSATEKEWVLDRMQFSLKNKPWLASRVYPQLWQTTKDYSFLRRIRPVGSAQERSKKMERIEKLKNEYGNKLQFQKVWQGKSLYGNNIYKNGNMYWTGTMDKIITLPYGKAVIKLQARGSSADNIWPYMLVELDGEEIGEAFVENPEWQKYAFTINTEGGNKVLSVTYLNDGANEKEDRNLYIGEAIVENR